MLLFVTPSKKERERERVKCEAGQSSSQRLCYNIIHHTVVNICLKKYTYMYMYNVPGVPHYKSFILMVGGYNFEVICIYVYIYMYINWVDFLKMDTTFCTSPLVGCNLVFFLSDYR